MDVRYEHYDLVFEYVSSRVEKAHFQRRRPLMDSSFEAMVPVKYQPADVFTKALHADRFQWLRDKLHILPITIYA